LTASTERLSPGTADERLNAAEPPLIVDVRSPPEYALEHLAGSVNLPLNHLTERAKELPADRPLLVHCAGGYRSSIASSLLQGLGRTRVSELAGGIAAWEASGLPVISGR
jgi:rhodanese-related sulfurtransferase